MPEPVLSRRGAPRPSMSIGEILERLRPEFPEVSISKIRFLEQQGLVEPDRAPSGYRRFSPAHLDRLRYVLSVQRDHYLPLRVIREHLEAIDRGHDPVPLPGGPVPVTTEPERPRLVGSTEVRLDREGLAAAAGVEPALVEALESFGLVEPVPGRGEARFDADALAVVRAAAALAGYGIEPRHLRVFRTAAEREADLVAAALTPVRSQRREHGEGPAEDAAHEVTAVAEQLHAALLKAAIRRTAG